MMKKKDKYKIYNAEEIQQIRESSLIVGKTLAEVAKRIAPGVPLMLLDRIAEEFIRAHNAEPSFKGYRGFPTTLCVSVNEVVVHGIPGNQILQDGDIVSIDCGVYKNGFHGDYAYTFPVGNISEEKRLLLERTKQSLYLGIEQAKVGNTTGDIGNAIQRYVESFGYGVVRDLCGHGCGRNLHEFPEVENFGKPKQGVLLKTGMAFCIEPMINRGTYKVKTEPDGWTVRTLDRKPSAHFEHQIALTENGTEILSSYEEIEKELGIKN
ncbi:MAG: type I methionyl aminopeptidase [Lentimicrobiaceae bacterium]|nr:type I methionyl aminopeptidase [Lentimicrobiaceae bacterium]